MDISTLTHSYTDSTTGQFTITGLSAGRYTVRSCCNHEPLLSCALHAIFTLDCVSHAPPLFQVALTAWNKDNSGSVVDATTTRSALAAVGVPGEEAEWLA